MDELILLKPTKALENDIKQYCQDYFDYGETHINGSCGVGYYTDFNEWLDIVHSIENEKLTRDNVHASTFFTVRKSDMKMIGSAQLRHSLSDRLIPYGGHIGYGICPSERKKGYGTQQLKLVLEKVRELNIEKVMISCDRGNIGSINVIKNNGGILEWEGFHKPVGKYIEVYWITL